MEPNRKSAPVAARESAIQNETTSERILKELEKHQDAAGLYATWKIEGSYLSVVALSNGGKPLVKIISFQELPQLQEPCISMHKVDQFLKECKGHSTNLYLRDTASSSSMAPESYCLAALLQIDTQKSLLTGDFWRPPLPKTMSHFPQIKSLLSSGKKLPHYTPSSSAWSWKGVRATVELPNEMQELVQVKASLYFLNPPSDDFSPAQAPPISLPLWIQVHHSVRPVMMIQLYSGWILKDSCLD